MSVNEPNIFIAICCTVFAVLTSWILVKIFKIQFKNVKYETVDGLRGYLSFFVFLHHACIYYYLFPSYNWKLPAQNLYIHFGQTSVALFFMITGFLFFDKLLSSKTENKKMDWGLFFLGRVTRIYPLLLFVIFVILILVGIKTNFNRLVCYSDLFYEIKSWILFGIFDKPSINTYNEIEGMMCGVLWSMKYEWIFYLSIPFFGLLFKQRPSIFVILICGCLIHIIYQVEHPGIILFNSFIYGLVAAFLVRFDCIKKIASHYLVSVLCCVIIIILVYYFNNTHLLLPQFLTGLIFIIIACGNSIFGILTSRFSKAFGQLAYSIYLIHGLILFIMLRLIIGDSGVCALSLYSYWFIILITSVVVTIISFFTYYYIELPAMNKTKALKKMIDLLINKINSLYYK